jgi:hypothetical protein
VGWIEEAVESGKKRETNDARTKPDESAQSAQPGSA